MKRQIFLSFVFLSVGCLEDPLDVPPPSVVVKTDKTSYLSGEPIYFTIRNKGDDPIVLDTCQNKIVFLRDRFEEPNWVLWYIYPCALPSMPGALHVPAGGTAGDTLSVSKTGSYRLRVPILRNNDPARPDTILTNVFDVVVN